MSANPSPSLTEVDQHYVELTIIRLLQTQRFTPGELFELEARAWDAAARAERDLLYAKLRGTLAHAFENPTPANLEAIGRAALECARRAMDEAARDAMKGME